MTFRKFITAVSACLVSSGCAYQAAQQEAQQAAYNTGAEQAAVCRSRPSADDMIVCFQEAMTQLSAAAPQSTLFFLDLTGSLRSQLRNGAVNEQAARETFEHIRRTTLAVVQMEAQQQATLQAAQEAERRQQVSQALWNGYQVIQQAAPQRAPLSFTNCRRLGSGVSCTHF